MVFNDLVITLYLKYAKISLPFEFLSTIPHINSESNPRGVARDFLEGGSKSSKMLPTGWTTKKILGYVTTKTVNFDPFSMRFHVL